MEKLIAFYLDVKSGFETNDCISDYSAGKAVGVFISIAFTTFIVTTILGLLALFMGGDLSKVLFDARQEFLQIIGLKLASYTALFLVAISFILYKFRFLTEILAWLVRSISNIGFSINAVLAGAIGGMIVSDCFDPKVSNSISSIIKLYLLISLLSVMFYLSTKIFSTGVRNEIDETLGKYKWVFTLVFGIVLCTIWWVGVNDEPWV